MTAFDSPLTTTDTSTTSSAGSARHDARSDLAWTRWMLWGNAVGAGVMGAATLIAPSATSALLALDGDPLLWRLVGSMWLGFATASAIGLRRPTRYRAIMVAQIIYKTTFVVLATPAAISNPGLAYLVAIFVALIGGYSYALHTSSHVDR